jgi:hypothetical protein
MSPAVKRLVRLSREGLMVGAGCANDLGACVRHRLRGGDFLHRQEGIDWWNGVL